MTDPLESRVKGLEAIIGVLAGLLNELAVRISELEGRKEGEG